MPTTEGLARAERASGRRGAAVGPSIRSLGHVVSSPRLTAGGRKGRTVLVFISRNGEVAGRGVAELPGPSLHAAPALLILAALSSEPSCAVRCSLFCLTVRRARSVLRQASHPGWAGGARGGARPSHRR